MIRRPAILTVSLAALACAVYAACNPKVEKPRCTSEVIESCGGVTPPEAEKVDVSLDCCMATFTLAGVVDGVEVIKRRLHWTGEDCFPDSWLADRQRTLHVDVEWTAVSGTNETHGSGTVARVKRDPGGQNVSCVFTLSVRPELCTPPDDAFYSSATNFPTAWVELPQVVCVNSLVPACEDVTDRVASGEEFQLDVDDLYDFSWGWDPDPDTATIFSRTPDRLRVLSEGDDGVRLGYEWPSDDGDSVKIEGVARSACAGDATVALDYSSGELSCEVVATTTVVSVRFGRHSVEPMDPFPEVDVVRVDNLATGRTAVVSYVVRGDVADPSERELTYSFPVESAPGTYEQVLPSFENRFGNGGLSALRYTVRRNSDGGVSLDLGASLHNHRAIVQAPDESMLDVLGGDALACSGDEFLQHLSCNPALQGFVDVSGTCPDFAVSGISVFLKPATSYLTNEMVVAALGEDAVSVGIHGRTLDECCSLRLNADAVLPAEDCNAEVEGVLCVSGVPDCVKSGRITWSAEGGRCLLACTNGESRTGVSTLSCDYTGGPVPNARLYGTTPSEEVEDEVVRFSLAVDDSDENPRAMRGRTLSASARVTVADCHWNSYPRAGARSDFVSCDLDLRPWIAVEPLGEASTSFCTIRGTAVSMCDVVRDIRVDGRHVSLDRMSFAGERLSDLDVAALSEMTWGMEPPYVVSFEYDLPDPPDGSVKVEAYGAATRHPGVAILDADGAVSQSPSAWTGTWTDFYRQSAGYDFLYDFVVRHPGAPHAVLDCQPNLSCAVYGNGSGCYALDRPLVFLNGAEDTFDAESVRAGGLQWKNVEKYTVEGTYPAPKGGAVSTLVTCDLSVCSVDSQDPVPDADEWWRGARIASDGGIVLKGELPDDLTALSGQARMVLRKISDEDGVFPGFSDVVAEGGLPVGPVTNFAVAAGRAEFELVAQDSRGVFARDRVTVTVLDVKGRLCADFNHDGKIDTADEDILKKGGVFRHWINDDADSGDVGDSDSDRPGAETYVFGLFGLSPNYDNDHVDGKCDLIDFMPVKLNVGCLKALDIADDSGIKFFLKQADGAVNVIWTSLTSADVRKFQVEDAACCGELFNQKPESSPTVRVTAGGIEPPPEFVRLLLAKPSAGVVMLEGRAETKSPLVFECKQGGKTLFRSELNLSISGVEEMYRIRDLRPSGEDDDGLVESLGSPDNNPDPETGRKNLIFLHGANVNRKEARAWFSEMFKRLWQSGARVVFQGVAWESDIGPSYNYQQNASNAFETAYRLASITNQLEGHGIVMAHSLGTMVAAAAIQDYGLKFDKFIMLNSAIPSEAFEPSLADCSPSNRLVHVDWSGYPSSCWAAKWHEFFLDNSNDDRGRLTWKGRFSNVCPVAVDFYSSGDEVLELYMESQNPAWYNGVSPSGNWGDRFSWHKQEIWKGRKSLLGFMGTTDWSGWGFRTEGLLNSRVWSAEDASAVTDFNVFKTNTVFRVCPESMTNAANPRLVIDAHLAQGIPALSPPTGRTNLTGHRIPSFDMNAMKSNTWPRPANSAQGDGSLHSDIKNVAFFYNHRVFEKIIEEGGL